MRKAFTHKDFRASRWKNCVKRCGRGRVQAHWLTVGHFPLLSAAGCGLTELRCGFMCAEPAEPAERPERAASTPHIKPKLQNQNLNFNLQICLLFLDSVSERVSAVCVCVLSDFPPQTLRLCVCAA